MNMKKVRQICLYAALTLVALALFSCQVPQQPEQNTKTPAKSESSSGTVTEAKTGTKTEPETDTPQKPVISEPRGEFSMEHTLKMLKDEKKLTVAYIGGSVTDGYGAADAETESWRALTTAWFRKQYPDAQVREVKASIGGTGSLLGVHRYDYEVLDEEPDLIFIEFAINDCHEARSYQDAISTMEGMVRKTLRTRPCADIIIVLTTDDQRGATEFDTMRAHIAVAKAYGIPYICIGQELVNHIKSSGESWSTYFTDYVHPNATGYAYYAKVVIGRLETLLNGTEKTAYITPDTPLGTTDYIDAAIILPKKLMKSATADGFSWQYQSFSYLGDSRYGGIVTGRRQDATLTFTFSGTEFGLFYDTASDAGTVSVTIDGQSYADIDAYAENQFPVMKIVANNLSDGTHTVTIRIKGHHASSDGYRFDIGAVLYR